MKLSYVSIVTGNIDELRDFYVEALGVSELVDWRHDGFRALEVAPDVTLALHSPEAYAELGLPVPDGGSAASMLTFDPGSVAELNRLHERMVVGSVTVVRGPFETPYGSLQAVFLDSDGNPFRLNTFAS